MKNGHHGGGRSRHRAIGRSGASTARDAGPVVEIPGRLAAAGGGGRSRSPGQRPRRVGALPVAQLGATVPRRIAERTGSPFTPAFSLSMGAPRI